MWRGTFSLLLLSLSPRNLVQGDKKVACPNDPSLMGYRTIDDINFDIYTEATSILDDPSNTQLQPFYGYNLCPGTTFYGRERLVPLLNNSAFICGRNGSSSDGCVISGGDTPVLLMDWPTSVGFEHVSFRGLTFIDSQRFSIGAFASSNTTAEFYDCHWRNGTGGSAIHNVHLSPYAIASSSELTTKEGENTVEVKGENVFFHNGRALAALEDLDHTQDSQVLSGMTIRVHDSSITRGFMQQEGGYRGFYNAGKLFLKNVLAENNRGTMFTNVVGGTLSVENCHFSNNNFQAAIRAIHGARVDVHETHFFGNIAFGNVVSIGSQVDVRRCSFTGNSVIEGGDILAFESSTMTLSDSCFLEGQSLTPVFLDDTSSIDSTNNFGEGQVTAFCDEMGLLHGSTGAECILQGDVGCHGQCIPFEADKCALGTIPATSTNGPVSPAEEAVSAGHSYGATNTWLLVIWLVPAFLL